MIQSAFSDFGVRSLSIMHHHALALEKLPGLHSDPFDRMLVARGEGLILMTADEVIEKYPVETFWCGK